MVYEAEDLLLGRKVAVKVLREQFASDPGFLARFQREARSSAALSHPNIVAVYDVGSEAGTQYIVMELVSGRTLKELIQEEAPLGAARLIDLGRQICEGMEYAHRHGIVHRDVKAHNILVTREGWAKIADFGIAVALGASSLTQSGYVVGSAHYISPDRGKLRRDRWPFHSRESEGGRAGWRYWWCSPPSCSPWAPFPWACWPIPTVTWEG